MYVYIFCKCREDFLDGDTRNCNHDHFWRMSLKHSLKVTWILPGSFYGENVFIWWLYNFLNDKSLHCQR